MARPQSKGLSYFPLVTEWDTKAKLVHAKYGLLGIGCLIALYQDIYREGYALKWDEDTELLFSATNKIPISKLREIIKFSIERGIFDNGVLDKYKTLTSHGIQKQWVAIAKASHRKIISIDQNLCLLSPNELTTEKTRPPDSERGVSSRGNEAGDEITQEEMPQIKINESIIKREGESISYKEPTPSPSPPQPFQEKSGYGILKNVVLSESEYKELCRLYRESIITDYIDRLGAHLEKSGKNYRSHFAAILDWLNRDHVEQRAIRKPIQQAQSAFDEPSPEAKSAFFKGVKARLKMPSG